MASHHEKKFHSSTLDYSNYSSTLGNERATGGELSPDYRLRTPSDYVTPFLRRRIETVLRGVPVGVGDALRRTHLAFGQRHDREGTYKEHF